MRDCGVIGPENGISALYNEHGKLMKGSQRLGRINPQNFYMNLKYCTVTFIVFAFCGVVAIFFFKLTSNSLTLIISLVSDTI